MLNWLKRGQKDHQAANGSITDDAATVIVEAPGSYDGTNGHILSVDGIDNVMFSTPEEWKEFGNKQFKQKNFSAAISSYTHILEKLSPDGELLKGALNNRAAAYLATQDFENALQDSCRSYELFSETNVKACYRASLASLALNRAEEASDWVDKGLAMHHDDESLKKVAVEVDRVLFDPFQSATLSACLKHLTTCEDLLKLAPLLRRIRAILTHHFRNGRLKHACDADPGDAGFALHQCAAQLPVQSLAWISTNPELNAILFADPDVGAARIRAHEALAAERCGSPLNLDPDVLDFIEEEGERDRSAYEFAFFTLTVLSRMGCELAHQGALERIVHLATQPLYRYALGDALSAPASIFYTLPDTLPAFIAAGGLPALVLDFVESTLVRSKAVEALLKVPAEFWKKQSDASLLMLLAEVGNMSASTGLTKHKNQASPEWKVLTCVLANIFNAFPTFPFERATSTAPLLHYALTVRGWFESVALAEGPVVAAEELLLRWDALPRDQRRTHLAATRPPSQQ